MATHRRQRRLRSGWKSKTIILAVLFGPVAVLAALFALLAGIYDAELNEMRTPAEPAPAGSTAEDVPGARDGRGGRP